jgi:4-diphosphocytidyl-2-C-methyl-D-erythritol kinase
MPQIALKAYAKINLGLSILGRREDGFHELRTVYQMISLADKVEVRLLAGLQGVSLEATGLEVPAGRENLAVRAAEVFLDEVPMRGQILISLHKRIPSASGMGGASSDAATVLRALELLARKRLPPEHLFRMAASLGSDVPFFLIGGRAVGLGRGEEVYPLPELPRCTCLILFSGDKMNTAEAYRLLRARRLTLMGARPRIESFCARMAGAPAELLANDFEPVVFRRFPKLAEQKQLLVDAGAKAALLTGSGSALFALFRNSEAARRAAKQWRGTATQIFVVHTVSRRQYEAQFARSQHPR